MPVDLLDILMRRNGSTLEGSPIGDTEQERIESALEALEMGAKVRGQERALQQSLEHIRAAEREAMPVGKRLERIIREDPILSFQRDIGEAMAVLGTGALKFAGTIGGTVLGVGNEMLRNARRGEVFTGVKGTFPPNFYTDLFNALDKELDRYVVHPTTPRSAAMVAPIMKAFEGLHNIAEFLSKGAIKLGLSKDRAKLLTLGMEVAILYGADASLRKVTPHLKAKVDKFRGSTKKAKSDVELVTEAEELVDALVPEDMAELQTARGRLIDTLRQVERTRAQAPIEGRVVELGIAAARQGTVGAINPVKMARQVATEFGAPFSTVFPIVERVIGDLRRAERRGPMQQTGVGEQPTIIDRTVPEMARLGRAGLRTPRERARDALLKKGVQPPAVAETPADIVKPDGTPYKTRASARSAMARKGLKDTHTVEPIAEGQFVIRPKETAVVPEVEPVVPTTDPGPVVGPPKPPVIPREAKPTIQPGRTYGRVGNLEELRDAITREVPETREAEFPGEFTIALEFAPGTERPTGVVIDRTKLVDKTSLENLRTAAQELVAELREQGLNNEAIMAHPTVRRYIDRFDAMEQRAKHLDVPPERAHLADMTEFINNVMREALSKDLRVYERVMEEVGIEGEFVPVLEEIPRAAIEARLKLDRTLETNDLTANEANAYIETTRRGVRRVTQKEMERAIEEGDTAIVAEMTPEAAQQFIKMLEEHIGALSQSEGRRLVDILHDVQTLLTTDPNTLSMFGVTGLTSKQRLAARRLAVDARRVGVSFREFLRQAGYSETEILLFARYIEQITDPIPTPSERIINIPLDPLEQAAGNAVIHQRKLRSRKGEPERTGPPLHESDVMMIELAKELPKPVTKFSSKFGIVNPQYLLSQADLMPLWHAYQAAEKSVRGLVRGFRTELGELRKTLPHVRDSATRIYDYIMSQSDKGRRILKEMGVKAPEFLTEAETLVMNEIRAAYDQLFEYINRVREFIGEEPLEYVEDYVTLMRTQTLLEKLGIGRNPVFDSKAAIARQYGMHSGTFFPFAKKRTKAAFRAERDIFKLLDNYATLAVRYGELAPFLARIRELSSANLPNLTGSRAKTFNLGKSAPNLASHLREWQRFLSGETPLDLGRGPNRIMRALRKNLVYSVLSFSIRAGIIQPTALTNTVLDIGSKYTGEGLAMSLSDILMGTKHRERALRDSNLLDARREIVASEALYDTLYAESARTPGAKAAIRDIAETARGVVKDISRGKLIAARNRIGDIGIRSWLQFMDFETAMVTWLGAEKFARERLGFSKERSARYADEVTARTQASSLPGDLAPIQRHEFGRTVTLFQTFVINNFNFLSREMVGLHKVRRPADIVTKERMKSVMRLVAVTLLADFLFEDIAGVRSPLPNPIRDFVISQRDEESIGRTALRIALGLTDPIPIISSLRYGSQIGGAALEAVTKLVSAMKGVPMAQPLVGEVAKTVLGLPGSQQVIKFLRGQARGLNLYESLVGTAKREEPSLPDIRRGRMRRKLR